MNAHAPPREIIWTPTQGCSGVLTRDGCIFIATLHCPLPGVAPWHVRGLIVRKGHSKDLDLEEYESEEEALEVASVFLEEATVPPELLPDLDEN